MKKFYKVLLSFALLVIITVLMNEAVKANDFTLTTNNAWMSGSIATEGQSNFYTVTISKPGYLTIDYQAWSLDGSYCYIYNQDMTTTYNSDSIWGSSDANPKTITFSNWMEAGSYVIKVYAYNKNVGDYKLKASFKAANNNETEPNNGFDSAMKLTNNNLVTGLLSRDDRVDFYKITLTSNKTLLFTYLSYLSGSYFEIWNDDFQSIYKESIYSATEENPKTHTYETNLNAGTYYVKVSPTSYGTPCGRYSLKYVTVTKVKSIKISNNKQVVAGKTLQLKATVSPSSATNKTISWSSDNTRVATVDAKTGKVTTHTAGTVHITASALDGSGASKSVTLVVKPKKVSSFKVGKSSYSKAIYAKWGYQAGVSGYQISYSTNKNFKNAKTKTTTSTGITIKKLSKKKYYVRVRAFTKSGSRKVYGTWSNPKTYRVKK